MEQSNNAVGRQLLTNFDNAAECKASVRRAREILGAIYAALLALPQLKLADGLGIVIKPYYSPQLGDDGLAVCGIDVQLEGGTYVEFTISTTGTGPVEPEESVEQ